MASQYTYTIRTDAVLHEIDAATIDEAAAIFAADEFPAAKVSDVQSLFAVVNDIDGAWCWIESSNAPDGARQSINC